MEILRSLSLGNSRVVGIKLIDSLVAFVRLYFKINILYIII